MKLNASQSIALKCVMIYVYPYTGVTGRGGVKRRGFEGNQRALRGHLRTSSSKGGRREDVGREERRERIEGEKGEEGD